MHSGVTTSLASDSSLPPLGEHSLHVSSWWAPKWGSPATLLGSHNQVLVLCVPPGQWTPMVTLWSLEKIQIAFRVPKIK
jgi:hypothetical protein